MIQRRLSDCLYFRGVSITLSFFASASPGQDFDPHLSMISSRHKTGFAPQNIPTLLLRHWKKLVAFQFLVIALTAGVLVYFPRSYVSEGKLILNIGRETVGLDATATAGKTINFQQSGRRDEMVSALNLLTSRVIYEKVVDQVGHDVILGNAPVPSAETGSSTPVSSSVVADFAKRIFGQIVQPIRDLDPIGPREEAIIVVSRSLIAQAERDSRLIQVQYEAESPALAKLVIESILEIFLETHRSAHFNTGSLAFFETQHASAKETLDAASEKFRLTKNQMQLSTIEGLRSSLDQQLLNVAAERLNTERAVAELVAQAEVIQAQLAASPERLTSAMTSIPNTGRDALASQLYTLQMKELESSRKFKEDHPTMKVLATQVREAERQLQAIEQSRDQETVDINPIHRERSMEFARVESQLAGERATLAKLDSQLEVLESEIIALNQNEKEIDDQKRQLSIFEENYRSYANKLEDARINSELQTERISSVNVVQPATYQQKPVSPKKLIVLIFGGFMAMFGSIAIVATSEGLATSNINPAGGSNASGTRRQRGHAPWSENGTSVAGGPVNHASDMTIEKFITSDTDESRSAKLETEDRSLVT